MSLHIIAILILTAVVYIISTLTYSARIVGVRTGKIAVSFAVFNVFALISRTANSIQAPMLAKTIENTIKQGNPQSLLYVFRWILFSTTFATIIGALLMPTFIRIFSKSVEKFSIYRSIPNLILHGFSKAGIEQFRDSVTVPKKSSLRQLKSLDRVPQKVILLNTVAFSISTVGVLASLYAGCLNPELRTTCSTLSSVINMVSTLIMFILVDPYISMLTDDVIKGKCGYVQFDRCIIFLVTGMIFGTLIAQILLIPAAEVIVFIAKLL
ncbi:MAG: lipid II flippase Amj family protein [Eubacteriales bacterium]